MRLPARARLAVIAAVAGWCVSGVAGASPPLVASLPQVPAAVTQSLVSSDASDPALDVHGDIPFVPAQPLDAATARLLSAQLDRARAAALRYPTVAAARAAGFIEATGVTAGVGAHFMKFSDISGVFDVDHPAMILYDGVQPGSRVAGLAYYVISGTTAPEGFAGPNDHWHQHPAVCVTPTGPVLAGDAAQTCRLAGRPAWMLHAWVAPAYPSSQGWFSPENVTLGGTLTNVLACRLKT